MDSNPGGATIVITRNRGGNRDLFRSYVVIVDGNPVGKIKRGQRVEFPVPAGQHELLLKIDWCTSPAISFEAQPGAEIGFFCEPGGSASAGRRDVRGDTSQYITLTRASTTG